MDEGILEFILQEQMVLQILEVVEEEEAEMVVLEDQEVLVLLLSDICQQQLQQLAQPALYHILFQVQAREIQEAHQQASLLHQMIIFLELLPLHLLVLVVQV